MTAPPTVARSRKRAELALRVLQAYVFKDPRAAHPGGIPATRRRKTTAASTDSALDAQTLNKVVVSLHGIDRSLRRLVTLKEADLRSLDVSPPPSSVSEASVLPQPEEPSDIIMDDNNNDNDNDHNSGSESASDNGAGEANEVNAGGD